jgi:hypothetical protein
MIYVQFEGTDLKCDSSTQDCSINKAYTQLNFFPTFTSGVDIVFLVTIFAVLWIAGYIALFIRAKYQK